MIYTSTKHLLTTGINASFGNHVLHLLYVLNVSHHRKIGMGIGCASNLDTLFDLERYKLPISSDAVCLYREDWGGTIEEYAAKESKNLDSATELLYSNGPLPDNFWVEGWFQHQSTLPSLEVFQQLPVRKNWTDFVKRLYPFLADPAGITLHYRGTDFRNANGWGDCRLSMNYYQKAINYIKTHHPEIKTVNVFSDEPESIIDMLTNTGLQYRRLQNDYYIDWLCLLSSKNLISSNSSFAFSVGKYNKSLVIQPRNFLLREHKNGVCFPVDPYYPHSVIL